MPVLQRLNTPSWFWRFWTTLQKEFVLFFLFYIADNLLSRIWPSRYVGTVLLVRLHHEVIMPVEVRIMTLEVALDFSSFAELVSLKFVLALLDWQAVKFALFFLQGILQVARDNSREQIFVTACDWMYSHRSISMVFSLYLFKSTFYENYLKFACRSLWL